CCSRFSRATTATTRRTATTKTTATTTTTARTARRTTTTTTKTAATTVGLNFRGASGGPQCSTCQRQCFGNALQGRSGGVQAFPQARSRHPSRPLRARLFEVSLG
ncbi:unnamed protein product, partial [Polarella glacialis]